MKPLFLGIGILVLGLVVSLFTGDIERGINLSGMIGMALWLISGILSGAFVSGDRIRANIATSTDEDTEKRRTWSLVLFLMGLPGVLGAVIYYALINK